ncbi:hypothetical protein SASPL_149795 [Salvia splendens]|uniref:Uncharacterized protein n=1 Tax=Salvia splendens TaxID=180675 RepID=A0A8X8W5G2_SALSN|nr:uncharacterized protein LOC121783007 isoform X1 [Salvia splendens]KAG6388370.1 hypothetical protein SASPL_149795 [Salvia splendens]
MEAQKNALSLKRKKCEQSNAKITSNSSSSAASAGSRLRFLLSSNSSSDASLPSSSSRARVERKPSSLPKLGGNFSAKSFRSKENVLPRKPFSEAPKKKKKQLCVDGRGFGKIKTNPMSKTAQMSNLYCSRGNQVKGCEELVGKKLRSEPPFLTSTPPRVRRNAAFEKLDSGTAECGNGSATTPPVEVSVSPQIQLKMFVSKSSATPVCYGAGHLLSGVTDKRKCRRRGSLRGGCEKANLFDDENVVDDLQDSSIPLPSEASVRWLLSPCKEGAEDQGRDSENKLDDRRISCGNDSLAFDLLSSPSTLCELECEDSDFRGSDRVDYAENRRKAEIFKLSRRKTGSNNFDPLLAATPNSVSNENGFGLGERNSSAVSIGSLGSGNLIQTPDSECSSYESFRRWNMELDSMTETLDAVSLSRCERFAYAGMDSSSRSAVPKKNVRSWESSSTLDNLALSQMRISWRDEEIDAYDQQLKPHRLSRSGREERNKRKEKDPWMDNDVSPVLLEYEPCISAATSGKATGDRHGACAESICTNAGDLAVSCDSDWANIQSRVEL